MIGNPKWFKRRKYGGWGLFPGTWQGVVYVLIVAVLFVATQNLPFDQNVRLIITAVLAIFFALDIIDIMRKLPMDERERIHEAFAERNALWAIIIVLGLGIGYQAVVSALSGNLQVDPVIIIALTVGVITKATTNIYLDKKN